nr:MAG TPA: hypothetical protein [Bacteriophage sp.]
MFISYALCNSPINAIRSFLLFGKSVFVLSLL